MIVQNASNDSPIYRGSKTREKWAGCTWSCISWMSSLSTCWTLHSIPWQRLRLWSTESIASRSTWSTPRRSQGWAIFSCRLCSPAPGTRKKMALDTHNPPTDIPHPFNAVSRQISLWKGTRCINILRIFQQGRDSRLGNICKHEQSSCWKLFKGTHIL